MKNILWFYHSGTGNTLYLVNRFIEELKKYDIHVDICDVTDITKQNWNHFNYDHYDHFALSYPIYGFRTPVSFETFIQQLEIKNKEYFIIKGSREVLCFNDSSSRWVVKNLKKKGNTLMFERHLLMPYDIHFRHDDRLVKQMLLALDDKVPMISKMIHNEYKEHKLFHLIPTFVASTVGTTLQKGGSHIGNSMYVSEDCLSCSKCANNCPRHNIEMVVKDGKKVPDFNHDKCMLCMRCIMNCPAQCISIKKYLSGWEVRGRYDFEAILKDDTIRPDFIDRHYKGDYAHSYKKYFFDKNWKH